MCALTIPPPWNPALPIPVLSHHTTIRDLGHHCHAQSSGGRSSSFQPKAPRWSLSNGGLISIFLLPNLLPPCSHTKGGGVRRLIWIQHVDTNDLVICPRRDITPVRRKSNSMNRARMVAHRGQLLRFRVGRVCRIINCIDRPYPYISI
jgi:hypothetical protein